MCSTPEGIGAAETLCKSDRFAAWFPVNVPPQYRALLALSLGLVAGVLSEFARSGNWTAAVVGGLMAGLMPIAAHDIVIDGARNGREIGVPPVPPTVLMVLVLGLGVAAHGCSAAAKDTACQMIRAADELCPYVVVVFPDGTREPVPRSMVAGLALQHMAARLQGDAGAPR
jgi:hypothetical protein